MVSRFFACAGVGAFFTLAASILAIFAHVSLHHLPSQAETTDAALLPTDWTDN